MGMAAESQFHVLAVDDSLIDRKLIEKLLKTSSYQVTTVDSGSKALEFLGLRENDQSNPKTPSVSLNNNQEVDVNLVITDYCMPGMTGYDLLKKIKESSSLRNIPVVIMSSENVPSRITRCLEEGAEEFFLKPVRLSDLNRLRPHMMKTQKLKKDQKLEDEEDEILETQEIEQAPLSLVEQQHQQSIVEQQHQQSLVEQQHQQSLVEQQHQQSLVEQQHPQPLVEQHQQSLIEQQQSLANNKRKTMEEGLSIETDRTRARYNGIATVV